MNKSRLIIAVLTFLIIVGGIPSQETNPPETPKSEFMHVDELKPGMKGYGVTAFENNQLERFDVEILGVMYNSFAGMDMILARLSGPRFKEIGVIAGMSGSPVYIEDRLIGAVAYGWVFAKEPIAGITPIKNMLEVFERTDKKPHPEDIATPEGFLSELETSSSSNFLSGKKPEPITISTDSLPGITGEFPESITLEPLNTPLVISRSHPAIMKRIRHYLADTPLMPVMGGGGHIINDKLKDQPIENGSGLAIPLMSGSMDMSAIGTVTYRKGDKLVAFGHPFFEKGNVDVPMASAYIYTIVSSYARPFKLGSSVRELGSIRQDRRPAIGGFFGLTAPSFDMEVHMKQKSAGEQYDFQYRIWEERSYAPQLADIALSSSLMDKDKMSGNAAADIHYTIELEDGTVIEKRDFLSTNYVLAFQASLPIYLDLIALMNNSFHKVDLKRIVFDIEIIDEYRAVGIETSQLDKEVYKPGDTVRAKVFFRAFRKPRFSRTVEMKLPDEIRDGSYQLRILDGSGRARLEYQRSPGKGNILSFEGLLENLRLNYPANRLYVLLTERESGIRLKEKEMPGLPLSVMDVTRDAAVNAYSSPVTMTFLEEETMDTDFEIRGSQTLTVKVNRLGRR